MFRQILTSISALTIIDLKNIESHLNSFSKSLDSFGGNYKSVARFLDAQGFCPNTKIASLFIDVQNESKLLREEIVAKRKVKKDEFAQTESKMVSLEEIHPLMMQKMPDDIELLNKAEKNLDLLIQLLSMYHNFYLIIESDLLEKEELHAMRMRDLLRNDLYVLHIAIISQREHLQKQQEIDHFFTDFHEERRRDLEFQNLHHKYGNKLRQDLCDEALIKKTKTKFDRLIEKIAEKGDELEFRAVKCEKKGKLELAAQLRIDASIANDLAHSLRVESAKLRKLPQERAARVAKLEQFRENCQQLIDDASQTTLATRHDKWWKVIAANVVFCMTGVGFLISGFKWLATGNFLFFTQKDSAKKMMDVKDVVSLMGNVVKHKL